MSADGNDEVKRGTSNIEEYGTIEEHSLCRGERRVYRFGVGSK